MSNLGRQFDKPKRKRTMAYQYDEAGITYCTSCHKSALEERKKHGIEGETPTVKYNTDYQTGYSFTLTVQSDCVNTVITDKTIINMSNKVSLAAVTQDVSFLDSIATSRSNPIYCGARTYLLSPTHSFLSISGSTMSLSTTTVSDVNVYNVDLTVSLTSYSGVTSITKSFVVTITCEV